MSISFQKHKNLDADQFGNDLILMNLDTRQVLVLNEAASVIWDAIELCPNPDELIDLMKEALPSFELSRLETSLTLTLKQLLDGGFLKEIDT